MSNIELDINITINAGGDVLVDTLDDLRCTAIEISELMIYFHTMLDYGEDTYTRTRAAMLAAMNMAAREAQRIARQTEALYEIAYCAVEDALTTQEINVYEQRFNEFWNVYPKKIAKMIAFETWKRIKPSAELHARVLTAIEAAKRSDQWQRDGGQHIPYPAAWLNDKQWDDVPIEAGQ